MPKQLKPEAYKPENWIITTDNGGIFVPYGDGTRRFFELDESFVGTPDYMGHGYFWSGEYKHDMRGATPFRTRLVHKKLCMAGLKPGGESPEHERIIRRYCNFEM